MDTKKRKLIYCPIEPLTERYTASWYTNFPRIFADAGFAVEVINGIVLEETIKVGAFLDINSTCHYKATQLQKISQLFHQGLVEQGTIFFFGDLEFWGIEQVRLLADMNKVKVYLTAFLHAASYTQEDAFQIAAPYQQYTEIGWIAAMDKVFVGSAYHKRQVHSLRLRLSRDADALAAKIHVTKNPLFGEDYPPINVPKQKKALLVNRFDKEKRPEETVQLFATLASRYPDWKFVVTTGRAELRGDPKDVAVARYWEERGVIQIRAGLTKAQYHQELAEAAFTVTHSIEENYGYCIAEALIYKTLPLMRSGLSHSEFTTDPRLLFNWPTDCLEKATHLIETFGTDAWPELPKLDMNGMDNIVKHLLEFQ